MYPLLRSMLFLLPAEAAHVVTTETLLVLHKLRLLTLVKPLLLPRVQSYPTQLLGLTFKNRVGLAAGFDKNATLYDAFLELGFGFVEIGTVTPQPQSGNPKPRLFRLKKDRALLNRMGFNNDGADVVAQRLTGRDRSRGVVGVNIGKNKVTEDKDAARDYVLCAQKLGPHADYLVINVSSPNTPGLRALQDRVSLTRIVSEVRNELAKQTHACPLLIKLSPDLSSADFEDIQKLESDVQVDGWILSNTTTDRGVLSLDRDLAEKLGAGGLSGAPVAARAKTALDTMRALSAKPIIAVGGIHSKQCAQHRFDSGAQLVQVYSGLVYQGPSLIAELSKAKPADG